MITLWEMLRLPVLSMIGILLMGSWLAQAELFTHPLENIREKPKRLSLGANLSYYTTSDNYNDEGTRIRPTGLTSYTRFNTDIPLTYGANERWTLFARLSWSYASVEFQGVQAESFGLADQMVGANALIHKTKSGITFHGQAQVHLPTYDNASAQNQQLPYLGSGTFDIELAGLIGVPFIQEKSTLLGGEGGLGFRWRSDDFSSLIPWTLGAHYKNFPKGFRAGMRFYGFLATGGSGTAVGTANPCTNGTAGGGSCFVGSPNPTFVAWMGEVGYRINEQFKFRAFVATSILGKAAPQSTFGGIGAVVSFGHGVYQGDSEPRAKGVATPQEYGRGNRGFVRYNFEATITRVNDRLHRVKMNKGKNAGVRVGQVYDIFSVTKAGKVKEAVARGKVTAVRKSEAVLRVIEYFREVWIDEGFIVKRPLQ